MITLCITTWLRYALSVEIVVLMDCMGCTQFDVSVAKTRYVSTIIHWGLLCFGHCTSCIMMAFARGVGARVACSFMLMLNTPTFYIIYIQLLWWYT